jgi:hypothetical protein
LAGVILCLAGCASGAAQISATLNEGAALTGDLPMNPLTWRVISSMADPQNGTMSTLYGNNAAVCYARSHSQQQYPAGAVIAVVTWTQIEDSRWFGAKIPSHVQSVEFVTVNAAKNGEPQIAYELYTGNPLKRAAAPQSSSARERIEDILSRRAAVMP